MQDESIHADNLCLSAGRCLWSPECADCPKRAAMARHAARPKWLRQKIERHRRAKRKRARQTQKSS